jgi:peroxiredoxin Q/BCP
MECKSLRDSGSEIRKYNVAYFAASVDPAETNREFAESLSLDYPILSDPEKTVALAYGVLNDAGSYARRWTFYIGEDGRILKIDKEVKPATSGADLVRNLQTLGFPKQDSSKEGSHSGP